MQSSDGGLLPILPAGQATAFIQTRESPVPEQSVECQPNAILVEELGLIGGLTLIFLFVLLFLGLILISFESFEKERLFQGYTVFGIFLLISIQTLFNIAVNIGLLPTKGLTLPFISYGGTSIIIMLSLIGIVLRINNENKNL